MKAMDFAMATAISEYVVLRHKPTGFFIPEPKSRHGRGGSHVDPVPANVGIPRLFCNERAAKSFLGQWSRGKFYCSRDYDGGEELTVKAIMGRNKKDFEMVSILIIPKDVFK